MEQEKIMEDLTKTFIKVLGNKSIVLNKETTMGDVEAWDSLNHIQLINALEKHYKIRFNLNELLNFKNVGDLCLAIQGKINSN